MQQMCFAVQQMCFALLICSFFLFGNVLEASESSNMLISKFGITRKNEINVRNGPGEEYKILWKFIKSGVPMEILHHLDDWYLIRDYVGEVGWVNVSTISTNQRSAIVMLDDVPICRVPVSDGVEKCQVIGILESNVIINVRFCSEKWCRVVNRGGILSGWVKRCNLWGIGNKKRRIQ